MLVEERGRARKGFIGICFLIITICSLLWMKSTAYASNSIYLKVGESKQISLGASLLTGKLYSGSWSTGSSCIKITSQAAGFCNVQGVYAGSATLTCKYKYYVGGFLNSSSWSCTVVVNSSSSGGSGGAGTGTNTSLLSASPSPLILDLAKDKETGKTVTLSQTAGLGSNYNYFYIGNLLNRYVLPGSYVTYSEPLLYQDSTTLQNVPIFKGRQCVLKPLKRGELTVRFGLAERRDNGGVWYYLSGYVTDLNIKIICSHKYDKRLIQNATMTQNEKWEYTCTVCGEKEEVEILPLIEASCADASVDYDGKEHGIDVSVMRPKQGTIVRYGLKEGNYNLTESPVYTEPGMYIVFYKIMSEGYTPITGSATVTIKEPPVSQPNSGNQAEKGEETSGGNNQSGGNKRSNVKQSGKTSPAEATETITIDKVPASVKVKVKHNKVTVTWKKVKKKGKTKKLYKQMIGCQVQCAIDHGFKTIVADRNIKKSKAKIALKLQNKKTYYIRVRYIGKDGVSNWTRPKRLKTK